MTNEEIPPLSDARKEQIKLRATFLNNIGIGVMLVGVFTPIVRVVYGDINPQIGTVWLTIAPMGCFLLSLALHFSATALLTGLSR